MQAVWGTDTPEIDETVAPKRQRLFIARQACEICRQKKTRCDGGNPCGLCRSGGLECRYAERKATKNEVSLGMIFNTLQRIEAKIEEGQQQLQRMGSVSDDEEDEDDDEDDEKHDRRKSKRKRSHGSHGAVQPPLAVTATVPIQPPPPPPPPAPPTQQPTSMAMPSPSAIFAARERRYSATATSSPAVDLASPSAGSTLSRDGHANSGINALLSAASPSYQQHLHQTHHTTSRRARHVPVIQYPIRQLANWPAIRELLHKSGARGSVSPRGGMMGGMGGIGNNNSDASTYIYDAAAATVLEQRRPPLPFPPLSGGASGNDNWLAQLNVAVVKDLGDKYFTTFNLGNPILDRRLFSQHSLGVAIGTGFGVNMESCIVLVTMALGVLGKKALREAGITSMSGGSLASTTSPFDQRDSTTGLDDNDDAWDDGLVFFNEARKRIGMLGSDSSLQACQYHLLCGLFYSQLIRPFDWWAHITRAVACSTSFWACIPKDCDEWTMDMQARLFWITAMFEAVLTQELDFPVSNLLNYEDRVPLPKFVEFPGMASFSFASPGAGMGLGGGSSGMMGGGFGSSTPASQEEEQDAFCHYHFLSQIAHRIILSRLCDSLFANRGKALASGQTIEAASQATTMARSDYPPQALEDELLHQLEQWRSQLPGYLQWEDDNAHRYADPGPVFDPSMPPTPASIFVVPWLQARYCIARYHLRRPLLHRALHHPDSMTAADFDKCRDALACAVRWCSIIRPTLEVMDCLYLKYFLCTQLFGMLLLFHTLERSTVPALRNLVPPTYEAWRLFAFGFLERYAASSPSVAREFEIVSVLRDRPPPPPEDTVSVTGDSITLAMEALHHQQQQQQPHHDTTTTFTHLDSHDSDRRQTRSSRRTSLHEL
ncbi:hypothetical protein SBRCBS47491_007294 [Sporothrix bragantina]|uniref:Zn(2)-C6 fungal-type domain-containing protein n=1 Tax=Sporothrix bragantina TaxID=671064 RepID=A0ABP0CDQ7_9PEZI